MLGTERPDCTAPPRQGRNDPCACGSGKKYKMCCGNLLPVADLAPAPAGVADLIGRLKQAHNLLGFPQAIALCREAADRLAALTPQVDAAVAAETLLNDQAVMDQIGEITEEICDAGASFTHSVAEALRFIAATGGK